MIMSNKIIIFLLENFLLTYKIILIIKNYQLSQFIYDIHIYIIYICNLINEIY